MGRALRLGVLLLLWLAPGRPGMALGRPLCRLERPVLRGGEIEVLATQVSLDGRLRSQVLWELEAGGGAERPLRQRPWQPAAQPLSFVLLVEASAAYAGATDTLREALARFLEALPPGSQGQLGRFAEQIEGLDGFRPAGALLGEAARYNATVEGELRLVRAVRKAEEALRGVAPGGRRALIVVADGRNPVMDPHLFYITGEDLGHDEVPLYALGFSPRDFRGPLRNLGDLAKRSGGTFRWARGEADLGPQLRNLADELRGAEEISFPAPGRLRPSPGERPQLRLRCGSGESNPAALQVAPAQRGPWWALALVVLAGAGGLWWRRRRPAARIPVPPAPLVRPPAAPPALVAADGTRLPITGRLELRSSAWGAVIGVIHWDGQGAKLEVRAPGVRLNGRSLVGVMHLKAGDRIYVDGRGEWVFRP